MLPAPSEAAVFPLSTPSPPASTPQNLTSGSSTKPAKIPIALLPPPTQATTSLGQASVALQHLPCALHRR